MSDSPNPVAEPGTDGFLSRMFLFVCLVVLPLGICTWSLYDMVQERFQSRLETVRQRMVSQAVELERTSKLEYQIKTLSRRLMAKGLLRSTNARIRRAVERLEKAYPGGFSWVFYDPNGKFRDLKTPLQQPSRRLWEGMVATLYRNGTVIDPVREVGGSMADMQVNESRRMFESMTQGSMTFVQILRSLGAPVNGRWLNQPAIVTYDYDAFAYHPGGWPKKVHGTMLMISFPEKLPIDFGLARVVAIRHRREQRKANPFPMAMIDPVSSQTMVLDRLLPQSRAFGETLRKAYRNRRGDEFTVGEWLVRVGKTDFKYPRRVLVLANIKSLLLRRERNLHWVFRASCLAFVLGILGFFYGGRIPLFASSLRWRITGFFLVAILVPVTSQLGFGGWMISREENRLRGLAFDHMRRLIEGLDLRFKDTPRYLEEYIRQEFQSRTEAEVRSVQDLVRVLDRFVAESICAAYYVSDPVGKVEFTNASTSAKTLGPFLTQTFRTRLSAHVDLGIAGSALRDAYGEEVEKVLALTNADAIVNRAGQLHSFSFMDIQLYFMNFMVKIGGKMRTLIIQLDAVQVEQHFAEQEFKANVDATARADRFQDDGPAGSRFISEISFFNRIVRANHQPRNVPQWQALETVFHRSYDLRTQLMGEVELDGGRFLYLVSPLPSMTVQSVMPCYITSLRPIEQRSRELRQQLMVVVLMASLVAMILGLSLAAGLLRPIARIDLAVQQVGAGNLRLQLSESGADELGRLSRNINSMVMGLRERDRMRAYVSETVLEAVTDESAGRSARGENIVATILFSDIRNFTRHAESHTPQEMFEMLNSFLGGVERIIRFHGGRVDKFIGDAVMAVFLPTGDEDQASRAVRSALAMRSFLEEFNAERQKAGLFTIDIGIGINTGEVLMGDVGSETRKDLTVIGDAVNLASRLETASKQGRYTRIVLAETTRQRVGPLVEVVEMEQTEVKGKAQAVRMFEVIGWRRPESA